MASDQLNSMPYTISKLDALSWALAIIQLFILQMRECHPEVFFHRFTVLGWVGREEREAKRMCVCKNVLGGEREGEREGRRESEWYKRLILVSQFYVTVFFCIMSGGSLRIGFTNLEKNQSRSK